MPDAYTGTAALDFSQTAYDRLAYFAFRPQLYFDRVAEVQPTRQSMPGSAVVFTIVNDLSVASTTLNESTDVNAVALSDSQVTVTLAEYGNAVITTAKLRGTSFVEVDPIVANVVGFNAGVSMDTVTRDVLKAGSNVDYQTSATNTPVGRSSITPSEILTAHFVRLEMNKLVINNVPDFGGLYVCYINPDVALDLREQTGSASWRDPHTYSQPGEIWSGELGEFEGFRFIRTPRAPVFADAGSSTTNTDVYRTLFLGRQALAKAFSMVDGNGAFPKTVPGPITDHLRRQVPFGWYWLGAYGIFRQAALRAVESASSVGANAGTGTDALAINAPD